MVTRFPIVLPDDQAATRQNVAVVAISPDGARIVYAANRQLYLRSMGDVEAKPIPGTNVDAGSPFFSPDGQWVGFFSYGDSLLRKIAIGGGSPVTLCKVDAPWGATWDGDTIFVASGTHGIMRVSANGGEPEVVVKLGPGEAAYGPQVLDGGRLLLYALATGSGADRWDKAQIIVQSMASGERHVVVRGGSAARYLPTAPDRAAARRRPSCVCGWQFAPRRAVRRHTPRAPRVPCADRRAGHPFCQFSAAERRRAIRRVRNRHARLPAGPVERRLPAEGRSPSLVATARSRRSACRRNRTFTRACRQTAGNS